MTRSSYREQDYAFGQRMASLRSALGLTQAELARMLGLSRRSVVDWEAGTKYPKAHHLKHYIRLAVMHQAFQTGHEVDEIRALWKAARQKELLTEAWLSEVLLDADARTEDQTVPTTNHTVAAARPLPFQPTTFVGRSAELIAIARLLANPACRLLTLHGPGGIGKTRLALMAAAHEADAFSDGIAFVPLASIRTPDQIVSAMGEALQISFVGQTDELSHLLSVLEERHLLLLLDNFEHLLAGTELLSTLLAHAPKLKMMVTSRERLNVQAEWLFSVDGLSFPQHQAHAPSSSQTPTTVMEYSAIELFLQRFRQVQPVLALDQATLITIGDICRHVAGMPLAIELAAASARMLSIADIEQQIRTNLDLLATSFRDVPVRHRSMRAVFNHSWHLLNEHERALFSRLAVFRTSWTADAAAEVTGIRTDVLAALTDKSLITSLVLTGDGGAGDVRTNAPGRRFMMLEPLRSYALEQLTARGENVVMYQAHAIFYLALAEAAAAAWNTPRKEAAIMQQGREHSNMRAALQWACDTGNTEFGLQMALALWGFWRSYGHNSEGRRWLELLLSHDEQPTDMTAIALRERAFRAAAWLASDQHDFAEATRLFEQSMALHRALGETGGETSLADVLRNSARQARAEGDYNQAVAFLEEVLTRHHAATDHAGAGDNTLELSLDELGQTLRELGAVLREQGNFVRATALLEQALALHRSSGDRASVAFALIGLGDLARDQGDRARVRASCEPSLVILRELGMQWALGFALNNLALAAYDEGDLKHAEALIRESVALFRAISADTCLSEVLISCAVIVKAQGDLVSAYTALREALRLASAVGPRLFVAHAMECLASVVVIQGDAEQTTRLLAGASALRKHMGTPIRPVDQADWEQTMATSRAMLGEDAFGSLWDEAQTQSLEMLLRTIPSVTIFGLSDDQSARHVG